MSKLQLGGKIQLPIELFVCIVTETAYGALDSIRNLVSENTLKILQIYGTNKEEWSKALLKQIPSDQLFRIHGGTKLLQKNTTRAEVAI